MTTLFEMAASLARADAEMLLNGVPSSARITVLDAISQATIAKELELPDWRLEELARKYAPVDAYEPDDVLDEPLDPRRDDIGPIADNE